MGVGIHGEPGRRRAAMKPANDIVDELLEAVVSDLPYQSGDRVALMINGLGGTPISELYLLYGHVDAMLRARRITPVMSFVGNYFTSLEMSGVSVTLTRLDGELDRLLRAPARSIGLTVAGAPTVAG